MKPCLTAALVIQSPCYYSHFFWLPGKNRPTFPCKKPLLIRPNVFGPLVTVLTGFYCSSYIGMVMKPITCLCYMFLWTWRCTKVNSIPIILICLLTNENMPLIYSVTIYQQKTKDCEPSRSFQHKLQLRCFIFWFLLSFITSLL